jgi:hypothetical protein
MAQFMSQGNFVTTHYIHFYSVDTIFSHPVPSLGLSDTTRLSEEIARFTVFFVLEFYCTRNRDELYTSPKRHKGMTSLQQRKFPLGWDRKTVRSCLLTAKQNRRDL